MATAVKLNKKSLLEQLARLSEVAKKNKWVFDYDKSIDHLTFGLKVMPDDSFLLSLNDEINLFLDKNTRLNGIFIENFSTNYIEHNTDLKPMMELFSESDDKKVNKEQEKLVEIAFEGEILQDSISALLSRDELITAI